MGLVWFTWSKSKEEEKNTLAARLPIFLFKHFTVPGRIFFDIHFVRCVWRPRSKGRDQKLVPHAEGAKWSVLVCLLVCDSCVVLLSDRSCAQCQAAMTKCKWDFSSRFLPYHFLCWILADRLRTYVVQCCVRHRSLFTSTKRDFNNVPCKYHMQIS